MSSAFQTKEHRRHKTCWFEEFSIGVRFIISALADGAIT
jgi:hypothetical protein